jgi:hypothetical protein
MYLRVAKDVIDRENRLLMMSVSSYLKLAGMCYLLADNSVELGRILTSSYLSANDKNDGTSS